MAGAGAGSSRRIHATLALVVLFPLFLTTVTGLIYRTARYWFNASKESVHWLLDIHQMSILGIESIYPILVGCSGLAMCYTGMLLLKWDLYVSRLIKRLLGRTLTAEEIENGSGSGGGGVSWWPVSWNSSRAVHRFTVTLITIPALLTFITGTTYTLVKHWTPGDAFNPGNRITKFLMGAHQGSWTFVLSPGYYVPLLGIGLCVVLFTGLKMARVSALTSAVCLYVIPRLPPRHFARSHMSCDDGLTSHKFCSLF